MFTPNRTRLEDILNSPAQFCIPVYQRDYKWGKEEALDLIDDLRNYPTPEGDNLFLGNFILENSKDKKIYVVDGQQRLTTIILLLIACRTRAIELKLHGLAQTILGKITFIDSTTAESKGSRLVASESIREVFEYITKDSWDGKVPTLINKKPVKRQANRLRPIYEYFRNVVSELDKEGLSKFLASIYNSFVIRIDIESEIDALSIFERTNARGMELEISDLLKNFLFSKKVEGVEECWKVILENSRGTILRMLKYFYISKRGHVLKPQLYKKLRGYAHEEGAPELTNQLVKFSRFYSMAKTADENFTRVFFDETGILEISKSQPKNKVVNFALQALGEFGVTQYYPPVYAAIECIIRNGAENKPAESKALIRLFEVLEKYHFINNAICERVGNEVEKLYADACVKFAESKNFIKTTDLFINDLREKLATEEEFIANFVEVTYTPDQASFIAYIFDRFNNYNLNSSQWLPIYFPNSKVVRKNQNIEHFYPQNPEASKKPKKNSAEESVDNIGNLLAISYITNSRLGNATPAKKIERLSGDLRKEVQNLTYIDEFISKYGKHAADWNSDKILNRAKDLALKAYREVWKF